MNESLAVQHIQEFLAWMEEKGHEFVIVGHDADPMITTRLDMNELATVLVVAGSEERREFLADASRAVDGWRRANKRQGDLLETLSKRLREQGLLSQVNEQIATQATNRLKEIEAILLRWQDLGPEVGTAPATVVDMLHAMHKVMG